MNYSLDAGAWNSVFAVPSSVVDKYIKLADGASLKLLLFLLRHGGESFTEDQLRNSLGIKENGELEDAAMFWFQRGIIRMDEGELKPMDISQEVLPEVAAEQETEPQRSSVRRVSQNTGAAIYTSGDIAKRQQTDPAVRLLFSEAEQIYGRPLRNPEQRLLLQITDFYGIPAEVAVMLLKYCFRIEKTTPSYITRTAEDWAENNIRTVDEADAQLQKLERLTSVEEKLRRAMELKTKFSPNQISYIRTWTEEWGFSEDMILLAHEMTQDRIGSMNFSYTNGILENWKKDGVYSTDEANRKAQEFSGKFKSKKQSSSNKSDIDDLMDEIRRQYQ